MIFYIILYFVRYERNLGGLEIQLRLRDYLALKFNDLKLTSNDVTQNSQTMAKLFIESGRLKIALSASADYFAQVEILLTILLIILGQKFN